MTRRGPRIVALAALVFFVLGMVGYLRAGQGAADACYDSLLLFTATYTPPAGSASVGWVLQVARFGALGLAGLAVASAAALVFRDQYDEVVARLSRRHVIVCGLGAMGTRLALLLRAEGHRVVGVDHAGTQASVRRLRAAGVTVIDGDARQAATLRRAGMDRARYLVALVGNDETNAAVGGAAAAGPRNLARLGCLVYIRDLGLCERLRELQLRGPQQRQLTRDFVNRFENAAQDVVAGPAAVLVDSATADLVVVEASAFAEALIIQVCRARQARSQDHGLVVTILDPNATEAWRRLRERWPEVTGGVTAHPVNTSLDELSITAEPALQRLSESGATSVTCVCGDDPQQGLILALVLRRVLPAGATLIVRADAAEGLAHLLTESLNDLTVVDTVASCLRPDILLTDIYGLLARAAHESYCDKQRQKGQTAQGNSAVAPWEQLSEDLRQSNLEQVQFLVGNLKSQGFEVRRADGSPAVGQFPPSVTERLAEREHDRWVHNRQANGWVWGRPRNDHHRVHPDLVPWDQLPEDRRELDREAVREYPRLAARIGYQVIRSTDLS